MNLFRICKVHKTSFKILLGVDLTFQYEKIKRSIRNGLKRAHKSNVSESWRCATTSMIQNLNCLEKQLHIIANSLFSMRKSHDAMAN